VIDTQQLHEVFAEWMSNVVKQVAGVVAIDGKQACRTNAGRKESPSYAIIDSQSVKTAAASEERGIDGGKNKGQEAAHRSGCAWLFAVCCSSCR